MNEQAELIAGFQAGAGEDPAGTPLTEQACASLLSIWQKARAEWPALHVEPRVLGEYLAARRRPDRSVEKHLVDVAAGDAYLACACTRQIPGAAVAFEKALLPQVRKFVAHLKLGPAELADLEQALRFRLLVPSASGEEPRIGQYGGISKLSSWLHVSAVRLALDMFRREDPRRHTPLEDVTLKALDDPAKEVLQARFGQLYSQALRAALAGLSSEQRNLLRLHFVNGLNGEQLGAFYKVNRSTIKRRLDTALVQIREHAKRALLRQQNISAEDFESLFNVLLSGLSLSLSVLLKESTHSRSPEPL